MEASLWALLCFNLNLNVCSDCSAVLYAFFNYQLIESINDFEHLWNRWNKLRFFIIADNPEVEKTVAGSNRGKWKLCI